MTYVHKKYILLLTMILDYRLKAVLHYQLRGNTCLHGRALHYTYQCPVTHRSLVLLAVMIYCKRRGNISNPSACNEACRSGYRNILSMWTCDQCAPVSPTSKVILYSYKNIVGFIYIFTMHVYDYTYTL